MNYEHRFLNPNKSCRCLSAVIFDFNGVLWLDEDIQITAWNEMCKELNRDNLSEQEIAKYIHGRNNRDTLEYLTGKSLNDKELHELIDKKETLYRKLCLQQGDQFDLSPGALDLFEYLKSNDIPRSIATASPQTNMEFFIEHFRLLKYFERSNILFDDGTIAGKPEPDLYLKAAQAINRQPEECIVIEDSFSGIEAASRAGIGKIIAFRIPSTDLLSYPGVSMSIQTLYEFPHNLLTLREEH